MVCLGPHLFLRTAIVPADKALVRMKGCSVCSMLSTKPGMLPPLFPVCIVQFLLGGVGEDRGTEGRDAIYNPGFPFSAFRFTSPLGFSSITTPTRRGSPVSSSELVPCPSFSSSLLQLFQHHGAFFSLKPFVNLTNNPSWHYLATTPCTTTSG